MGDKRRILIKGCQERLQEDDFSAGFERPVWGKSVGVRKGDTLLFGVKLEWHREIRKKIAFGRITSSAWLNECLRGGNRKGEAGKIGGIKLWNWMIRNLDFTMKE